jgi:hypothetical protein
MCANLAKSIDITCSKSFPLPFASENSAQECNLWSCVHEKDLLYFLEEDNKINRNIKEESDVKKQSCLNLYNLEETKENYKVKKNQSEKK